MSNEHGTCFRTAVMSLAFLMMSGCSSTTTYVRYSRSELELVPEISFPNLLLPRASSVAVEVSAAGIDSSGLVKALADQEYVVVTDRRGREVLLPFSEITRIRHRRVRERSKESVGVGETAGYALIYGPMIPVAAAALPFLRAFGLDEGKNSADERKAFLVYGGMSREDLRTHVGEPKEVYSCDGEFGPREVWVFEDDQVLRGGRALFINLGPDRGNLKYGIVYHNSVNTTFFKDSCSLISER